MGLTTAANLATVMDELAKARIRAYGDGATYGLAEVGDTWGAYDAGVDMVTAIGGMGIDEARDFGAHAQRFRDRLSTEELMDYAASDLLNGLDAHVRRRDGVNASTLNALLTYLNITHATKWQCLIDPQARLAWYDARAAYPNKENVYFECEQGATYAQGLRGLLVGTGQTAGFSIADANFAGGFPEINCTVFNGSSDTVTVTGTQRNPADNTTATGKTWTATVNGTGNFPLSPGGGTPADTDALILAVSDITAGASITSGSQLYAEAHAPSGRGNLS